MKEQEKIDFEPAFTDSEEELFDLEEQIEGGEPLISESESDSEPTTKECVKSNRYRGKFLTLASKQEEIVSPQVNVLLYLRDLVKLLAVIVVVFLLLFRIVVVSGTSMNDTLLNGDYLLLLGDTFYRNPKQGDIIVASKSSFDNGSPIVKRVIATEGQWVNVDFSAGIVYVGDSLDNMTALVEPYTKSLTTNDEGMKFPLQVSEGCVFVLGDNRGNSKDSRDPEIGLIDEREILGKVIFLFFPGTNYGREEFDLGRIGVVK